MMPQVSKTGRYIFMYMAMGSRSEIETVDLGAMVPEAG